MPLELAGEYIAHRIEKDADDKIFARWIAGTQQYEMSFKEFKESLMPHKERSDEDILQEVISKFKKAGIG